MNKDGLYSVEEMTTKGSIRSVATNLSKRKASELAKRGAFRSKTGKNGPIIRDRHVYRYYKMDK